MRVIFGSLSRADTKQLPAGVTPAGYLLCGASGRRMGSFPCFHIGPLPARHLWRKLHRGRKAIPVHPRPDGRAAYPEVLGKRRIGGVSRPLRNVLVDAFRHDVTSLDLLRSRTVSTSGGREGSSAKKPKYAKTILANVFCALP